VTGAGRKDYHGKVLEKGCDPGEARGERGEEGVARGKGGNFR